MTTTTTDTIRPGDGTLDDDRLMAQGCHYDYIAQRWVDGHDHAHFTSDTGPLYFCGADWATCQG
ncbi:MAG TPA: hypothetical protein VNG12_18545 [Acidimicrobiales bacterium]|nr:hypothetical protein [Acidimicrobiales bacterium]